MTLEVAILDVKPSKKQEFESVFSEAQKIISSMSGYISHQLQRCKVLENQKNTRNGKNFYIMILFQP